ncbi:MAG: hypothetical protein ACOCTG_04125 [Bacteroidota bacterium]
MFRGPTIVALLLLVVAAIAVLTGCPQAGADKEYRYEVEISVTGGWGDNMDVEVADEASGQTIAEELGVETPVELKFGGLIDYSAPVGLSVAATAENLAAGEEFAVRIRYTEKAYNDPVTYTVEEGTGRNSSGAAEDTTYATTFVVPYQP